MNFSCSKIWNYSIFLRYPINKIKKIGNLYFYENNNILKCQNFFDFNISIKELDELRIKIGNMNSVRFNYIDSKDTIKKIKNWSLKNNYVFQEIDSWEAPRLEIGDDIKNYLKNNDHSQIKKNYKHYLKNQSNYNFYISNSNNILELWSYALEVDFDSWKKNEHSDMKSLDREDLQYLPFLLQNQQDSSLVVICSLENKPLAYSLMFRNNDGYWYAVKWGASTHGREEDIGFFALFYHLEYLFSLDKYLKIDFWGRRNKTYDYLKNSSIIRKHILISKKGD